VIFPTRWDREEAGRGTEIDTEVSKTTRMIPCWARKKRGCRTQKEDQLPHQAGQERQCNVDRFQISMWVAKNEREMEVSKKVDIEILMPESRVG